jgi:hypothetical protein
MLLTPKNAIACTNQSEARRCTAQPPRPPLALQGLKLLPIPNLRGAAPFLLPTCATLVAWNVLAGLNVSIFCSPPPAKSLSSDEDGGSTGGGLERKVYGFEVGGAVSWFPLFVDVGLVVRGVVRSLKFEGCDALVWGRVGWCCGCPEYEVERLEMSFRGLDTWRGIEAGSLGGSCVSGTLNVRVNSTVFVSVVTSFGLPKKDMMLAVPSAALLFLIGALRASMSLSLASSCAEFNSCMREAADVIFGGIDVDAVEKPAGFCIVTLDAGMNPATGTVAPLCCSFSVLRRLFA